MIRTRGVWPICSMFLFIILSIYEFSMSIKYWNTETGVTHGVLGLILMTMARLTGKEQP